jgi:hypothetical protein
MGALPLSDQAQSSPARAGPGLVSPIALVLITVELASPAALFALDAPALTTHQPAKIEESLSASTEWEFRSFAASCECRFNHAASSTLQALKICAHKLRAPMRFNLMAPVYALTHDHTCHLMLKEILART